MFLIVNSITCNLRATCSSFRPTPAKVYKSIINNSHQIKTTEKGLITARFNQEPLVSLTNESSSNVNVGGYFCSGW